MTPTPLQWLTKKWGGTRLAHEAVLLEDAREVLRTNRAKTAASSASPEDSDLHVGDVTINNAPSTGTNWKPAAALAAALAAGGLGYLLGQPNAETIDTDTDTKYRLEFVTPEDPAP